MQAGNNGLLRAITRADVTGEISNRVPARRSVLVYRSKNVRFKRRIRSPRSARQMNADQMRRRNNRPRANNYLNIILFERPPRDALSLSLFFSDLHTNGETFSRIFPRNFHLISSRPKLNCRDILLNFVALANKRGKKEGGLPLVLSCRF